MNESSAQPTGAPKMDFAQCSKNFLKVLNVNETFTQTYKLLNWWPMNNLRPKRPKTGPIQSFQNFSVKQRTAKKHTVMSAQGTEPKNWVNDVNEKQEKMWNLTKFFKERTIKKLPPVCKIVSKYLHLHTYYLRHTWWIRKTTHQSLPTKLRNYGKTEY